MFRFSNPQPISGKLDEMLQLNNLTVQQLFQIENIIGDIKHQINSFVDYCKKHRGFTTTIIQLALDTSPATIQSQSLQNIVYVATEFLSSDQDALADLFFPPQATQKTNQDLADQLEIKQEITQNIQPIQKLELVKMSLNILRQPTKNLSCLGYLSKLFSFLVRKDPYHPIQFFSTHPQYSELLQKNIFYDSIANLIVQIVTSEDKNRQYKFQSYKLSIFNNFLSRFFQNIENDLFIEGAMNFVQEVLNNTKQSYFQYFQDFKRCANVLVSETALSRLCDIALQNNHHSFTNAITYIYMILKRVNSQNQQLDYYEMGNSKKQPTMNFQITFFYHRLDQLIGFVSQVLSNKQHPPIGRALYLSAIVQLMKNQSFKQSNLNIQESLKKLLSALNHQNTNGIIKNTLYQIIYFVIDKSTSEQITNFVNIISSWDEYLSKAHKLPYDNNNSDEQICFHHKIILLLKDKSQQAANVLKEKFTSIQALEKKYKTVLTGSQSRLKNSESVDFNFLNTKKVGQHQTSNEKQVEILLPSFNRPANVPALHIPQKKLDIVIDLDTQGVIIQHQEVQRVQITSPKRGGNLIGFMGVSSPRSLQRGLIGSDRQNLKQIIQQSDIPQINKAQSNPLQLQINHKTHSNKDSKSEQNLINKNAKKEQPAKDQIQYYIKYLELI